MGISKDLLSLLKVPSLKNASVLQTFWVGASYGILLLAISLALITSFHIDYGISQFWIVTVAIGSIVLSIVLFALVGQLILTSLRLSPTYFVSALGGAIGLLMIAKQWGFGFPDQYFYLGGAALLIATTCLFGASTILFFGRVSQVGTQRRYWIIALLLLSASAIGYSLYWLHDEGADPYSVDFEQGPLQERLSNQQADPSTSGPFEVVEFTYGSGVNNHRSDFGDRATYQSEVVDGTYILPSWKGKQARKRSGYWGFGIKEWPINGLVWMPKGVGPFPVVLIVHGNHGMEEYSDPGYAYLGELLASRGFLTVSVDENFINGSFAGDFRGKELPARAWLLLKHLEQWRAWNDEDGHDLQGKADLDNVVLIGHSRGGEAVPIAAAFNELDYFPDDARVKFDFGFGIKGVVAIAPTDYRYDRRVHLRNVNYLGIQGSYDSDEDSFYGLRQLQRTHFDDDEYHVRAGVWLHGANHGQFNTVWGRHDAGFPRSLLLNTAPMISGEDQRQYAKVLISSFLEISLRKNLEYEPVFRDIRHATDWLPQATIALNVYEDHTVQYWVDYEEDIDLLTAAAGRITTKGLAIWQEDYLQYRAGLHQENTAVIIGWEKDSIADESRYSVTFSDTLSVEPTDNFTLSVAAGDPGLLDDVEEEDVANDFTIVLTDINGNELRKQLSDHKKVSPRFKVRFLKTKALTTDRYKNEWEPLLETMILPFTDFEGREEFNFDGIISMHFEFPGEAPGIVMIDRIGVID